MKITTLLLFTGLALAQAPDAIGDRSRERIVKSVRKEILSLPYYGPFDWIT